MGWFSWFRRRSSGTQATLDLPQEEDFLWVEGRRHSKELPYLMPNDQHEFNRLDFQHYLIRYVMQCNYIAPITDPRGILDVGCGTGRWARELAIAFPHAKVFGLDVHADSEKLTETLPSNYRFIKGNVLEELPFPDMTFDFVHQRFLHVAIPVTQWQHVIQELKRVTRPGGWIELAESDQLIQRAGPAMSQLTQWGLQWSQQRDIDPRVCVRLPVLLKAAGLINIQSYRVDLPLGSWGGRIGTMTAIDMYTYNRAIKPMLIKQSGIDPNLYDRATEAMKQEWETNQSFFSFYITCAQRF